MVTSQDGGESLLLQMNEVVARKASWEGEAPAEPQSGSGSFCLQGILNLAWARAAQPGLAGIESVLPARHTQTESMIDYAFQAKPRWGE